MASNRTVLRSDDASEVERRMVEHAHDLAMSKDPCVAVRGRYMKEVGPAFLRWMTAELERRPPDLENICEGFAQALANQVGTLAGNITQMNERLAFELVGVITASIAEFLSQVSDNFAQVKE